MKVLLIEDSEENRFLVKAYLKTSGFEIDEAEDGEKGYNKFLEGTYDIILMDLSMPVMNGYESTRNIRIYEKNMKKKQTPIIAFSAHDRKEDIQKCFDEGCNGYIVKPVTKEKLFKMIEEYV